MSNYTKTTDFAAKDSLPTGDAGKIIRGAEFGTEFDNIATAIATKADTAGPTLTGTTTFDTLSDGTIGVTAFVDEDDMSSDSATMLPTQQSVKAYVDSQTTAQDLDFEADTGGPLSIDLDSETLTFTGGTGIDTTGSGNDVSFAIDSTVATLTGTQTLTNKTLTSPDVDTPDIDGGTIDGATIATSDITVGTGKTLDVSSGTLTLADDQISGDKVEGGTIASTTITSLASTTVDTTNLEVTNIKAKDGTSAGSIADTTGVVTLASSVLTTADINGGTIDGATIGGTTAAAGSFTTVSATGNITVDGTVDGRDVATDGTKLDGIEALADVTDTTNVTAAGALMDSELTDLTAVKSLDQGVATTDTPTFAGLATTADVSFGDNDKAIFGAGSDLEIYHDGTDSFIKETGAGSLKIWAKDFEVYNAGGTETLINADVNAGVQLYFDNAQKLATSSTGIDVTGSVTADGVEFGDSFRYIKYSATDDNTLAIGSPKNIEIHLDNNGGGGDFRVLTGSSAYNTGVDRFNIDATTGDISFYEDTGTTAKLFWDASAESLGIGTSSPSAVLDIQTPNAGSDLRLTATDGSSGASARFTTAAGNFYVGLDTSTGGTFGAANHAVLWHDSAYGITFATNNSRRMTIDSSGNVGIGASSPDTHLHVQGSSGEIRVQDTGSGGGIVSFRDNGTSSIPSIQSSGNNLLVNTGGSERMRIDASGQVGIGTSSPSAALHVSASPEVVTKLSRSAGSNALVLFEDPTSTNAPYIGSYGNAMAFGRYGGGESMRIDSSGNLLVGKTSAAVSTVGIEVRNNGFFSATRDASTVGYFNRTTNDGEIVAFRKDNTTVGSIGAKAGDVYLETGDTGIRMYDQSDAIIPVGSSGVSRDAAIDLGISFVRFKDLYLSNAVHATHINLEDAGGTHRTALDFDASSNLKVSTGASAGSRAITFFTENTEQMRLDSSGNLLVGRTTTINFPTNTTSGIRLGANRFDMAADSLCRLTQLNNASGEFDRFYIGSSIIGSITGSGSTTSYNTSSDQRLKDNIVDAPSASDDIDAIQVRSFDWKADGSHQKYGMVAQELNTVAPEAVSAPEDPEKMMGVDYSKLVPMLVKEIQSLRARVAQLETN